MGASRRHSEESTSEADHFSYPYWGLGRNKKIYDIGIMRDFIPSPLPLKSAAQDIGFGLCEVVCGGHTSFSKTIAETLTCIDRSLLRTPSLAALPSLGNLIALRGCAGAVGGCGVGDRRPWSSQISSTSKASSAVAAPASAAAAA